MRMYLCATFVDDLFTLPVLSDRPPLMQFMYHGGLVAQYNLSLNRFHCYSHRGPKTCKNPSKLRLVQLATSILPKNLLIR